MYIGIEIDILVQVACWKQRQCSIGPTIIINVCGGKPVTCTNCYCYPDYHSWVHNVISKLKTKRLAFFLIVIRYHNDTNNTFNRRLNYSITLCTRTRHVLGPSVLVLVLDNEKIKSTRTRHVLRPCVLVLGASVLDYTSMYYCNKTLYQLFSFICIFHELFLKKLFYELGYCSAWCTNRL